MAKTAAIRSAQSLESCLLISWATKLVLQKHDLPQRDQADQSSSKIRQGNTSTCGSSKRKATFSHDSSGVPGDDDNFQIHVSSDGSRKRDREERDRVRYPLQPKRSSLDPSLPLHAQEGAKLDDSREAARRLCKTED